MNRTIFLTGSVLGLLAVLLGAFGAHGLEKLIAQDALNTFETGVKYQMYHSLFLLLLAQNTQVPPRNKTLIYYCIFFGTLLFSFSIYFLATNKLTGFDFRSVAFLTPMGGTLLILGWLFLGLFAFKKGFQTPLEE